LVLSARTVCHGLSIPIAVAGEPGTRGLGTAPEALRGRESVAAGERCEALQADAMNHRIGMSVHQPTLLSFAAIDQGHP